MSIDSFIFKLAILLIPGFISLQLIKMFSCIPYSEIKSLSTLDLFIILLLSLVNAAVFDLISMVEKLHISFSLFEWIISLKPESNLPFSIKEFFILIGVSLLVGIILLLLKAIAAWILSFKNLRLPSAKSFEDVWSSFAIEKAKHSWVTIRDYSKDIVYSGYIDSISNRMEKREIMLSSVTAYKMQETDEPLFETEDMYLTLDDGQFTIELQKLEL
jgi:hypothetical protein